MNHKTNKQHTVAKETIFTIVFFAFLFLFYLMWMVIQPLDASPDEHMRYQVAEYMYLYGKIPRGGDVLIRDVNWGISYAFNPILPNMISALFMKLVSIFTTAPHALLLAARMTSLFAGMGTAFFTYRISRKLFRGKSAWIFLVFVTMLPEAVFMTSYVNCDALAIFSTAIIIDMWIGGLKTRWDLRYCVGLAVGMSICILSYYNAYGFLLCSLLLFVLSIFFCYKGKTDVSLLMKRGIVILLIVAVLCAWWFIRNAVLYDGDIFGMKTSSQYAEQFAIRELRPSNRVTPKNSGTSIWRMLFTGFKENGNGWLLVSTISFIGCFGQLDLFMPKWMVYSFAFILGVGVIFCIASMRKLFTHLFNWIMLLAAALPILLSLYYSYTSDYQSQGRYWLPGLLPIMYFVTKGYEYFIARFVKTEKGQSAVTLTVGGAFGLLTVVCYLSVFYPYYR